MIRSYEQIINAVWGSESEGISREALRTHIYNIREKIYTRIDAPEDTHGVLKMQEKNLLEYAEQMGFTVAGTSSDLGSGLNFERPGLQRMTAAAQGSEFELLLVKNLSRLGRDTQRAFAFMEQLGALGISVFSPLEGEIKLDTAPWNSAGMELE